MFFKTAMYLPVRIEMTVKFIDEYEDEIEIRDVRLLPIQCFSDADVNELIDDDCILDIKDALKKDSG